MQALFVKQIQDNSYYLASMETSVPFFCTEFWRSIFMRIEEMKNVDIRTVDPESLVSVNFLTYTTCI